MNRSCHLILAALLLVPPVFAAAPRKPPLTSYAVLWTQSPFTVKPPPPEGAEVAEVNPFEEWALGGVSSVGDRRLVTLFHRKEAGKQLIIDSGDPAAEFKVVDVTQDADDYKKTTVRISKGNQTGSVSYDDQLMAGRQAVNAKAQAQAAAQAKAAAAKAGQPQPAAPGAAPAAPAAPGAPPHAPPGSSEARQPRMRVIPQPKK